MNNSEKKIDDEDDVVVEQIYSAINESNTAIEIVVTKAAWHRNEYKFRSSIEPIDGCYE